jgi:hypothetical protein
MFIAAVIWGILLLVKGIPLTKALFEPYSDVAGILVLILAIFDKWAWHWKVFHPWLLSTPYIEGSWKGIIKSNWINPETGKVIDPIDSYLIIRQKFSTIHARLITEESSSEPLTGDLIKNPDETWQFVGAYRNTPKILIRERSPIHHGTIMLQIKEQPPTSLEGDYWTDRNTQGEIVFTGYNRKKFHGFSSASKAKFVKRN